MGDESDRRMLVAFEKIADALARTADAQQKSLDLLLSYKPLIDSQLEIAGFPVPRKSKRH